MPRSRIAGSIETALNLGKGVLHVAYPRDDVPETEWETVIHSQHYACDRCGRSFEPLSPPIIFRSTVRWAGVRRVRDSACRPARIRRHCCEIQKLTLPQGAIGLWPLGENPLFRAMLDGFCRTLGIPQDTPFEELGAKTPPPHYARLRRPLV